MCLWVCNIEICQTIERYHKGAAKAHTEAWELLSKFALIRWLYKYVWERARDVVLFFCIKPSADSAKKATFCIASVELVVEITGMEIAFILLCSHCRDPQS